jgi:L-ascorbate metabolism protein UlaG (beta-lactamase superfamily)
MRPPGISFDDLPPIDVVLLSHNHYDHADQLTLRKLYQQFRPRIFTALGVNAFLEQNNVKGALEMDWWHEQPLSNTISLTCVPAQHFSGRGFFDRDATLWCGFVVRGLSSTIHFVADTGYSEKMFKEIGNRIPRIDVAIVPIGAYKPSWFMSPIHASPEEAVKIHLDLKARRSIASHFGTFPLADDGEDEPQQELKAALSRLKVPEEDFLILPEGRGIDF